MRGQLVLIPTSAADWRLDERTRETGRKGVAAAREALRMAHERARPASESPSGADGPEEATATADGLAAGTGAASSRGTASRRRTAA